MPLYEYLCESCGRTIELIQSFSEPPLTLCDRCGGPVKRLISAPAVQFKGSGWYVSDYGKSGSAGTAPKKESASSESGSSSSDSSPKPSGDKPASGGGSGSSGESK